MLEQEVRVGALEPEALDKAQAWSNGTTHRHMRNHAGGYHNQSNRECSICTHTERAEIEAAILDGRATMDDFSEELDIALHVIEQHMKKHTIPLIQRQVNIEMVPKTMSTVQDSLQRIQNNMNRLDNIMSMHLDGVEMQYDENPQMVSSKDLDLALKMHREVRETLSELAKWMDKVTDVETSHSVSVMSVLQSHFSEKAPDEWRELRKKLAEAGVMDE
jgi:hypothetical protein